jgi:hypothetical protein
MTVSALAVTKMGSLLVVEVATTPPPLSTDVGVDLGLTSLAALSTWGCHRETRGTPLQGARSGPSATRSGPEEEGVEQPREGRHTVTVVHRRVWGTRLDGTTNCLCD